MRKKGEDERNMREGESKGKVWLAPQCEYRCQVSAGHCKKMSFLSVNLHASRYTENDRLLTNCWAQLCSSVID